MSLTGILFDKNSGQCYRWPADSTTSPRPPGDRPYAGVRQVRAGAVCRDPDSARRAGFRHLRARNVRDGTGGCRGGGTLLGRVRDVLQPRRPGRPHRRARHRRRDGARRRWWLNQRLALADVPAPAANRPLPPGTPTAVFEQFGIAPGTAFANAHLEATKTSIAAHFGAIVKVSDQLSFGANFLTQAKVDYSGTA